MITFKEEWSSLKKIVHAVAGGPKSHIPNLANFDQKGIFWIGVDRGVYYLLEAGIIPDVAVGDFDSISEDEWAIITHKVPDICRFHPEKDETDMELAFTFAVQQNPSLVKVFGATGGRLDHFMANAFMLASFKENFKKIDFELIDVHNTISVFLPGTYELEKDAQKKFVSFIPLSPHVIGLTLKGFKYPLMNKNVPQGSSLCISNELIQKIGTFSFEKGILMMIRSKD